MIRILRLQGHSLLDIAFLEEEEKESLNELQLRIFATHHSKNLF
jgi:hypothetical protein